MQDLNKKDIIRKDNVKRSSGFADDIIDKQIDYT